MFQLKSVRGLVILLAAAAWPQGAVAGELEEERLVVVGEPVTIYDTGTCANLRGRIDIDRGDDGVWLGAWVDTHFRTSRSLDNGQTWSAMEDHSMGHFFAGNAQVVYLGDDAWYAEASAIQEEECHDTEGEFEDKSGGLGASNAADCEFLGHTVGTARHTTDGGATWEDGSILAAGVNFVEDLVRVSILKTDGAMLGASFNNSTSYFRLLDGFPPLWEWELIEYEALGPWRMSVGAASTPQTAFFLERQVVEPEEGPSYLQYFAKRSLDGGETWSLHPVSPEGAQFTSPTWSGREVDRAGIAVSPSHRACAVWSRWPTSVTGVIYAATSDDNGETWSAPQIVAEERADWVNVSYFDETGILIIWRASANGSAISRFHYTLSYDNGVRWSPVQTLFDDENRPPYLDRPVFKADGDKEGLLVYQSRKDSDCEVLVQAVRISIADMPELPESATDDAALALQQVFAALQSTVDGALYFEDVEAYLNELFPPSLWIENPASELFASIDSNGDGVLNVAELRAAASGHGALHSADTTGTQSIGLSELLRVIQFFSVGEYHCAPAPGDSEDGYQTGPGERHCPPHASDYNPQNWSVSLGELLRAIQFFNMDGYHPCDDSEDGYCPGPAPA